MSKRSSSRYQITDYTKQRAKQLNVTVTRSKSPKKKIDIFNKSGKKVGTAGAIGYMDYPTYMKSRGKKFADKRRSLYRQRHKGENKKIGSNGYWAWNLLW